MDPKKAITEFESMLEESEMRALSALSLKQPLTEKQTTRYLELGKKAGMI